MSIRDAEPLRVVDDAKQWTVAGDVRQKAENRESDQQRFRGGTRDLSKRSSQRISLWLGQRVDAMQHRCTELVESCERECNLGFDTRRMKYRESRGRVEQGLQQCGLSDPGIAVDNEYTPPRYRAAALISRSSDWRSGVRPVRSPCGAGSPSSDAGVVRCGGAYR